MHHTKNDLSEKIRQNVVTLFQERLSNGIDLVLQAKHAHWNVKGPNFIGLHKLFDKVHADVEDYVDLLAERIAQLGGIAQGTLQATAQISALPWFPLTILDGFEHVEALSHSLAVFGEGIRSGIAQAAEWEDAGSADILTHISRGIDKNLWLVESQIPVRRVSGEKAARGAA